MEFKYKPLTPDETDELLKLLKSLICLKIVKFDRKYYHNILHILELNKELYKMNKITQKTEPYIINVPIEHENIAELLKCKDHGDLKKFGQKIQEACSCEGNCLNCDGCTFCDNKENTSQ